MPSLLPTASGRADAGEGPAAHRYHHFPPGGHGGKAEPSPEDLPRDFPAESGSSSAEVRHRGGGTLHVRPGGARRLAEALPEGGPACVEESCGADAHLNHGRPADETNPSLFTRVLIWMVRMYQTTLSPLKRWLFLGAGCCRFHPTCSQYAIVALRRHGLCKGLWLAAKRVMCCPPWGGHGYDPVPPKD